MGVLQYSLLIVKVAFTVISEKNCYENNQQPLKNVEQTNRRSEGQTGKSDFTGSSVYGVQYTKLDHICLLNILLIYLDIGCIPYQTMFNWVIQSRVSKISVKDMHILFSYEGVLIAPSTLQHNHLGHPFSMYATFFEKLLFLIP